MPKPINLTTPVHHAAPLIHHHQPANRVNPTNTTNFVGSNNNNTATTINTNNINDNSNHQRPIKSNINLQLLKKLPNKRNMIEDKNLKSEFHITEQTVVNGIIHTRAAEKDYFDHKYEFGEKLGQGAFGVVEVVTDRQTLETFACKQVKKIAGSTSAYEQVMREIELMKKINHPHILLLKEVLETPKKVYMILEYCQGGELIAKLRKGDLTQDDARIIISRLADAISFIHKQGIVHRDIKPENILLSTDDQNDPWNIKVSDFGLATSTNACSMMDNIVGTPLYMAPEIVKNSGYSSQCDVWSIGILMYLLLCGYTKEVESELIRMVQKGEITYPEKFWANVPQPAHHLIDMMLRIDPAKRISAKEILNHPWIKGETSVTGDFSLNANVLDLMRSYNAERRLRKVMIVVRMAIRWRKVGASREKAKAMEAAGITVNSGVSTSSKDLHSSNHVLASPNVLSPKLDKRHTSATKGSTNALVSGTSNGSGRDGTPDHARNSLPRKMNNLSVNQKIAAPVNKSPSTSASHHKTPLPTGVSSATTVTKSGTGTTSVSKVTSHAPSSSTTGKSSTTEKSSATKSSVGGGVSPTKDPVNGGRKSGELTAPAPVPNKAAELTKKMTAATASSSSTSSGANAVKKTVTGTSGVTPVKSMIASKK